MFDVVLMENSMKEANTKVIVTKMVFIIHYLGVRVKSRSLELKDPFVTERLTKFSCSMLLTTVGPVRHMLVRMVALRNIVFKN